MSVSVLFGLFFSDGHFKLPPGACFSDLAASILAASRLVAWMGKHSVSSHEIHHIQHQTKRLWNSRPWNLCRLTQVSLIFIFSSAHDGSCFWRGWQLMWLMEPLLIGFVSPLCSRFRRSECLPWRKSPMMPNRAEGICCQPLRHKVWSQKKMLCEVCVCVFVVLASTYLNVWC